MIAYLQKSEESEGFHQIVDFLIASHIRYAFTENPTIYVSLIEQFWHTTSASTLENGDMEITATIDGKVKIVSEASIRRHLKLEDSDVDEAASICVDVRHGGAAIIVNSLDTRHGSGNIHKTLSMPHESPLLRVYTHGSDEGRMQHNKLMESITKLSDRVVVLENDLKQTKKTYGAAFTKLIKKVKTLENTVKGRKIAEIDEDLDIFLVQQMIHHDAKTQGRQEHDLEPNFEFTAPKEVYTTDPDISTANVPITKRKDKGKAIMKEAEPVQKKTNLQLEQERLAYEEALKLQEQLDEEERQRLARVHEEASTFNAEE
ncbi:hypothetical protein Tco_0917818 [Tanacetum coccineum]